MPFAADGQLKLDDNTWGVGVNLGVLYELDARTRLGLTYNSQVKLDFRRRPSSRTWPPGLHALLRTADCSTRTSTVGIKVPQG